MKIGVSKGNVTVDIPLPPGTIGLFTVAILGPFSARFQTRFQLIFVYLAEKQTKGMKNDGKNDVKSGYHERSEMEISEK